MNEKSSPVEFTRQYVDLVTEYCEPLFANTPISYFSHIQYFPDCSGIALSTNYQAIEFIWARDQYLRRQDLEEMPDYHLLSKDESTRNKELCELIGINHMVLCHVKYASHYEVNSFGANGTPAENFDFYMNNSDLLTMFCNFFRDNTQDLITQAKITPYPLEDFNRGYIATKAYLTTNENLENKFKAERLISKYKLSPRELQCLELSAQSKSVKEIAREIGLSPNTVKFYIKNLKTKVNCSKIAEIIKLFYENAL